MLNREIAKLVGVSERTVYRWIKGETKTPKSVIAVLESKIKAG
jgi:transposase